jgi:hypothetical protein
VANPEKKTKVEKAAAEESTDLDTATESALKIPLQPRVWGWMMTWTTWNNFWGGE